MHNSTHFRFPNKGNRPKEILQASTPYKFSIHITYVPPSAALVICLYQNDAEETSAFLGFFNMESQTNYR